MQSFQQDIQKWVALDNQLRLVNQRAKEIRDRRNQLTSTITQYMQTNRLQKASIQISDGRLKFAESSVAPTLTFKYLEECLRDLFPEDAHVQRILRHVRMKRARKTVVDLKRFYNNKKDEDVDGDNEAT